MKNYAHLDYTVEQLKKLLSIDSPTGFTAEVAEYTMNEFKALGFNAWLTNKGCVAVDLGGEGDPVILSAHIDTLGGMVAEERILAIISPDSSPIKRVIQDVREKGQLIDASFGRKTQAVLIMDSGHVILSALTPDEIAERVSGNRT